MGTNTLNSLSSGQTITEADPNQYRTALDGTQVPRSAGVPTDLAGDLGSISTAFQDVHAQQINAKTTLNLRTAGTTRAVIDATGMTLSSLASRGALADTITNGVAPYRHMAVSDTISYTTTTAETFTNGTVSIDYRGGPLIYGLIPASFVSASMTLGGTVGGIYNISGGGISPSLSFIGLSGQVETNSPYLFFVNPCDGVVFNKPSNGTISLSIVGDTAGMTIGNARLFAMEF